MTDPLDRDLISAVARDTLTRVAPEELILFSTTSEAYFQSPERVTKRSGQDNVLGFGAGLDVAFLTPVVLYIATEVVRFVADELAKAARKEGAAVIANYVHAAFGRLRVSGSEREKHARLTEAQLARVHDLAVNRAIQMNIPADKAAFLADAMIGTLSTA
jgi:hypothetical protein